MDWSEAVRQPLPDSWRQILRLHVPFYGTFGPATRQRFAEKLKIFVLTKEYSGKNLVVDDTMKVVIAATACRLSLNLQGEDFARLRFIVVHRDRIKSDGRVLSGRGSASKVNVVWNDVLSGLAWPSDGHNVGYHEFAHALDDADGQMDGRPRWCPPRLYGVWADEMRAGVERLRKSAAVELADVIDAYGATDEIEFFAVATETFFERPVELRQRHPKLYRMLSSYYHQDPASSSST